MTENEQLTIMFTDISSFTSRTSTKSRAELNEFLEIHEGLIVPIFGEFGGRIVKTIGDSFLAVFKSPTNALLCGIEIQRTLKIHNQNSPEEKKLEVRVAINSGEVSVRDNDIFGEPVNIAARIERITEVNEIYFTEAVYLTMNKNEIPTAEIGYRTLKGIPHEIKIYKVLSEGTSNRVVKKENPIIQEKLRVASLEKKKVFNTKRSIDRIKNFLSIVIIIFLIFFIANLLEKNGGIKTFQAQFDQLLNALNKAMQSSSHSKIIKLH